MALKGNLRNYSIVDILSLVTGSKKTGVLKLNQGARYIILTFVEGLLVEASGYQSLMPDILSHLVEKGTLRKQDASDIEAAGSSSSLSVSEILLLHGVLSKESILELEQKRFRDYLEAACTWTDGLYCLESLHKEQIKKFEDLYLDAAPYLDLGRTLFERMLKLEQNIPAANSRLTVTKTADYDHLSPETQKLLDSVQPGSTIRDLIDRPLINRIPLFEGLLELIASHQLEVSAPPVTDTFEPSSYPVREREFELLTKLCREFVRSFTKCVVNNALYPPSHPMIKRMTEPLLAVIKELQENTYPFSLHHFEGRLFVDRQGLAYPDDQFSAFVEQLKQRLIRAIIFLPAITADDLVKLMSIVSLRQAELKNHGGIKTILIQQGISSITIEEMGNLLADSFVTQTTTDNQNQTPEQNRGVADNSLGNFIARSPAELADFINQRIEISQMPTLAEYELRIEVTRNTLEKLILELPSDELNNDQRTMITHLQKVIEKLPSDLTQGLLFSRIPALSPLIEVFQAHCSRIPLAAKAEMIGNHIDNQRELYRREGIDGSEFMTSMQQDFNNFITNISPDRDATRQSLVGLAKADLFERGIPLKDIEFIFNIQSLPPTRVIELLKQLESSDPLLKMHEEFLEETKEVIRYICSSGNDEYLYQVVQPYNKRLFAASFQVRQQAAETLREIAEDLINYNKEQEVSAIVDKYICRLEEEELFEVYMTLAKAMERLAIVLRSRHFLGMSAAISKALMKEAKREEARGEIFRRLAIQSASAIKDDSTIQELVKLMEDRTLHEEAARSLSSIGEQAIPYLINLLGASDKRTVRLRVISILRDFGPTAVPHLEKAIRSLNCNLRQNVCTILASSGNPTLIPKLGPLVFDPVDQVRKEAVTAIGSIGGPEAEKYLITALKDSCPEVGKRAAIFLGRIGGAQAVKALITIIDRKIPFRRPPDDQIRVAACEALGRLGDQRAVKALSKIFREMYFFKRHDRTQVSIAALHALASIGGPKAKKTIMRASRSTDGAIRRGANEALMTLDKRAWAITDPHHELVE